MPVRIADHDLPFLPDLEGDGEDDRSGRKAWSWQSQNMHPDSIIFQPEGAATIKLTHYPRAGAMLRPASVACASVRAPT